jgi:hypothetical protein
MTTTAGSRYLVQLCKHWSHKFPVEYTPEQGRVPFGPDRTCTFEATPDALVMRLETADQATLERMQKVVVDHPSGSPSARTSAKSLGRCSRNERVTEVLPYQPSGERRRR